MSGGAAAGPPGQDSTQLEMTCPITAIAAVARNGVIGADNAIPWRISDDFKRFRARTTGGVLVMGRRTWDSIGRALPGRHTVVVTRNPQWRPDPDPGEQVHVAASVASALELAATLAPLPLADQRSPERPPIWIAGGGDIYRLAWPHLTELDITHVEAAPEGSVTFPAIDPAIWQEFWREDRDGFSWVRYRRLTAV